MDPAFGRGPPVFGPPVLRPEALQHLRDAALSGDNFFEVLMDVVHVASLGQISDTLFEVGGRYRRSV